jgi:alpha-galactosidase
VNEICPDALFLNYTNPMSTLTRALCISRTVPRRTVGLCHEWIGVRENLAKILAVPSGRIQARVAGVNHLIWITDLFTADRRLWDEVPALAEKILSGEIAVDADDASVFADHARVKATLFQLYGALPAAGDRHIAEFFPHFLNQSTHWGADYDLRLTSIADRQGLEMFAQMMIESVVRGETDLAPFMAEASTEAANKIIRAVVCGEKYAGILNLPNTGQITNLPRDAIVETFGVIDRTGTSALSFGEVPAGVQNILEHHIRQQEMTVEAALTGSWDLALQVLLNDPLSSRLTIPLAKHMLRELLEANKVYLPKFFGNPS